MYNRVLGNELLRLSDQWSVISVTGPRQSGKTTLCRMTFPNYHYVNLEDDAVRTLVQHNVKAFLLKYPNGLILDEAQYLPELFSYVQVVVDENPKLRYILSGSSDFLLMQNITQSLAGRVAILRLLPLSIEELGQDADMKTDRLMLRGFYPAIWGAGKHPKDVYDSYLNTYIQRDVRQLINIKDLSLFRRFLTLMAARVGNEFNATHLSNELGISHVTIKQWLSVLEASYTAFTLPPYYRNVGKRLVKTPKMYFYDTGLVCYLLGIQTEEQLESHPLRGAIFENMVVADMIKDRFNRAEMSNLYYYRDQSQHEVDVVQEFAGRIRAYEIKSSERFLPDYYKNLNVFRKLYSDTVDDTIVIYSGQEELPGSDNGLINFRHIPK